MNKQELAEVQKSITRHKDVKQKIQQELKSNKRLLTPRFYVSEQRKLDLKLDCKVLKGSMECIDRLLKSLYYKLILHYMKCD